MSYPARVWIDDQCDACGAKGLIGVCFGMDKPVICGLCLRDGLLIARPALPDDPGRPSPASQRRRFWAVTMLEDDDGEQ